MSAEQNIQTARQMYQAFGSGDVQAILDRVADDVDWSTDAAIASAPWYGPGRAVAPGSKMTSFGTESG
ncbi:MAG TPA: hypothetical protein VMK84_07915 [Streptosporangiaceae bacterium]|nr:hypothetical protein [Streptosporangiaceae bacterium]